MDSLYVIGDGSSVVKIGRAADPVARLSTLQTSSPRPLSLLRVFPEAGSMERQVHVRFESLRVHREWFDFGDDDPVVAVSDAIADIRSRCRQPLLGEVSAERRRELREEIRAWGSEHRALNAERDELVIRSLARGITKAEIHQFTGLGRTTIDRIQQSQEG